MGSNALADLEGGLAAGLWVFSYWIEHAAFPRQHPSRPVNFHIERIFILLLPAPLSALVLHVHPSGHHLGNWVLVKCVNGGELPAKSDLGLSFALAALVYPLVMWIPYFTIKLWQNKKKN